MTDRPATPPILTWMLRRLLPGGLGDDALEDLRREYVARRANGGRIAAWGWYAKHLLTPHTYALARRLRRHERTNRTEPPGLPTAQPARRRQPLPVSPLDVKLAVRMLVKYPGLTVVGGVGMAVAIAIGAGFFSFFRSHMDPTLPLEEGDRIVGLENWNTEVNNEERRSYHDFHAWRRMRSVVDVSAFRTIVRNLIDADGAATPVAIAQMTASGFRVARVAPVIGRPLLETDGVPGAPPVLVIGHRIWHSRFAGDSNVVGREVRLGDQVHTIVGVMPEDYAFPMNHAWWTPLAVDPTGYARGEGPEIFIFGRLAPGVAREEAQAELAAIGLAAAADSPETHGHLRPQVLPYTYPLMDIQDVTDWWVSLVQGMMSLILVVVAVNVAVLAYARTATRRREIAVRTALGASRRRIVGQLSVEALVLSVGAGAAGLFLAQFGIRQGNLLIETELGAPAFWWEIGISRATVVYVGALTVLAAVIVGVVPALQATGRRWSLRLRESGSTGAMHLGRTWTVLIVAQVAIATFAIPAAAALGWSQISQATTRTTFGADDVLVARLVLDREPRPGPEADADQRRLDTLYTTLRSALVRQIRDEPGVAGVTMAAAYPGYEPRATIEVEGGGTPGPFDHPIRSGRIAGDFFAVLDVPIVSGRGFHAGDFDHHGGSAIVNRTFVDRVLGGGNPLGRRFRYVRRGSDGSSEPAPWSVIVGVVADLSANTIDPELVDAVAYHPAAHGANEASLLAVRVQGIDPGAVAGRFRSIAASLDPMLRLRGIGSLGAIDRQERIAVRLVALILGFVVLSVLLLSAAGIYALMSFTVTQRRREIGIRTALGAHPTDLLAGVFYKSGVQLSLGVTLGVGTALIFDAGSGGNLMAGQGALLLPIVATLMVAVGLLAAAGPARRGLRIQPTEALKEE